MPPQQQGLLSRAGGVRSWAAGGNAAGTQGDLDTGTDALRPLPSPRKAQKGDVNFILLIIICCCRCCTAGDGGQGVYPVIAGWVAVGAPLSCTGPSCAHHQPSSPCCLCCWCEEDTRGKTDRRPGRQTDRQMDRQTDSHQRLTSLPRVMPPRHLPWPCSVLPRAQSELASRFTRC